MAHLLDCSFCYYLLISHHEKWRFSSFFFPFSHKPQWHPPIVQSSQYTCNYLSDEISMPRVFSYALCKCYWIPLTVHNVWTSFDECIAFRFTLKPLWLLILYIWTELFPFPPPSGEAVRSFFFSILWNFMLKCLDVDLSLSLFLNPFC